MRDLKSNSVTYSKIKVKVRPFFLAIISPKNKSTNFVYLYTNYHLYECILHSDHQ